MTDCSFCHYKYDEWFGDSRNGVPAGVPIGALAGTVCSRCGLQGVRHEPQANALYAGIEVELYDQFAGKAGIAFARDWVLATSGGLAEPPRVLELGTGTGRIAVELAQHGMRVCGVDRSREMLKLAEAKRQRVLKGRADSLELAEQPMLELELAERAFTHALCLQGVFQHITRMSEHRTVLRRIREHLAPDGLLAVELLLPPAEASWKTVQRKLLPKDKIVYRHVEGETSWRRQTFRVTTTFETFVDGLEQPRYRVERELALMTPKELVLLLESEGFDVVGLVENEGASQPWGTVLPTGLDHPVSDMQRDESLETLEAEGRLGTSTKLYKPDAWRAGGLHAGAESGMHGHAAAVSFTVMARKR
ncbi:class I SAM-dependent methyltransferase [Paenibacillus filicis]|uniref:Class I SAM-dependent methyltransferase n=1 Tax=Paenibacillus filicis TaxID=669464 RepID=A0ABU9DJQ8_9BACL